MKTRHGRFILAIVFLFACLTAQASAAPRIDPELSARLAQADASRLFGVILTFEGERVTDGQVAALSTLGITTGVRMKNLPIVAVNATRAQIEQLAGWGNLRSIYLNAKIDLYLHQTKPIIGVTRLQQDAAITARNGGMPVSGRGVTVAINDSGIDGGHPDLKFNPLDRAFSKTIQNVQVSPSNEDGLVVRTDTLGNVVEGILPAVYVEDVINTDTHVGHGTHVAGIVAGTGQQSGNRYAGVAPGAKLVGLGSGGVLFVLSQIASFDYILSHQFDLNIRVVNNSWGNSAVAVDPYHPINLASKRLYENNIVVVFANGNDGPDPNSQNRWASVPWVISVGATTKHPRLASFSSRGIFGDPVIHPTAVTPGSGGGTGMTSYVIAARSTTNLVANGLDSDTEIPPAFIPYYTQIQGTSMAAPHMAGVVALMLEANPSLSPDEVKSIIERTATPLSVYDEFEAGAGLANAHAAVDLAMNPSKPYGEFGFDGKGFVVERTSDHTAQGTLPRGGRSEVLFEVPENTRFAFIQLDWGASAAGEDEVVIDNTNQVLPDLALTILRNGQTIASSNNINLSGFFGTREGVKLEFPQPGIYTARVNEGLFLGATTPTDQPFRLTFTTYVHNPNNFHDLAQLDTAARTSALRLVYDRVMFADGGYFRPADALTRMELGRALMFGARVPQFIPSAQTFVDLPAGSVESLIAESLKKENVIGLSSASAFEPGVAVNRLELAVALVRAVRMDAQAKQLAGTNVSVGGQMLTDNAQIPSALRGYVQVALDQGLLRAYPAEVKEIAPGQYQVMPGPRFEPARTVTRADFIEPATRMLNILFAQ